MSSFERTVMSTDREIRAFDYVNQPYERVRDAVKREALAIFHRATSVATDRREQMVASLSVDVAGVELRKSVRIRVGELIEDKAGHSELSRIARLPIEWEAADDASLFPSLKAEIAIYPLTFTETEVELRGTYEPPLGVLGGAIDRVVGHRLAEASVHRFIGEVVEYLRRELK
jgi:hypothetical protein